MMINEKWPAYVFAINGQLYIIKMSLTGKYELFELSTPPYKHFNFPNPFEVQTFISEEEFDNWRKNMLV